MNFFDDVNSLQNSINKEMQNILNQTDNYSRLEAFDRLLPKLKKLAQYEKNGLFEFDPSAEETYLNFLKRREEIVKNILKTAYSDLMQKLKSGTTQNEILQVLETIRHELRSLESKDIKRNYFDQLYNSIDRTIETVSQLPDDTDLTYVTQQILGTLN